MALARRLLSSVTPPVAAHALRFPEENLLSSSGFFITRPGALLKNNRYKILRKLGRGRRSSTFLVEDRQCLSQWHKYIAAKILSVDSTKNGFTRELECLQAVLAGRSKHDSEPFLPILRDHFAQMGPHGMHYCFLTDPLDPHMHALQATAPAGQLAVHIVKPIIAYVVDSLRCLHSLNIIHADIRSKNVHFTGPSPTNIKKMTVANSPIVDGTFQFDGKQYPILRSQPFPLDVSWDITPYMSELMVCVVLNNLGAALWADKPKPPGDIGEFAFRAPENIVRAECDKKIDIWAIGCMTYELLTGQTLFQPQPTTDLTADESQLLLQYALTGETLSKEVFQQSRAKEKYFDSEGILRKSKSNPHPRQTVRQLMMKHCHDAKPKMSEVRIDRAAKFIQDCLRLNPRDRPDIDELLCHQWLEKALMQCCDNE